MVKVGLQLLFLIGLQNCVTQKISAGRFVQEAKGYTFIVPSGDWAVDKDAWIYERAFGNVTVKDSGTRYRIILRGNRNQPAQGSNFDIRPLPRIDHERLIFNLDIGFQHRTQPIKLLIGTISEGDVIKFLKGNLIKTDSDLPKNLVAGYFQRLVHFYSSPEPASITSRKLLHAGPATRLEWNDGEDIRVLYGIALNREYLFFSLQAENKIRSEDLEVGRQALDALVESCVRLPEN